MPASALDTQRMPEKYGPFVPARRFRPDERGIGGAQDIDFEWRHLFKRVVNAKSWVSFCKYLCSLSLEAPLHLLRSKTAMCHALKGLYVHFNTIFLYLIATFLRSLCLLTTDSLSSAFIVFLSTALGVDSLR